MQAEVWACLDRGEHVLAEAPTGNGKTLAAFLRALSDLASGRLPADRLSVLYISPLKALNEDIRRNLDEPLEGLRALAAERGLGIPPIAAETRSGDTPESARRHFLRHPPSILCTTPESLAILLDSTRARPILAEVRCLILDEIHAIAGTKRGALLACSLGRLALLAGEYRRIALSATLRPAGRIAEWFAGLELRGVPGRAPTYARRPITLVAPRVEKRVEFRVEWPPAPATVEEGDSDSRYAALVPALRERIAANRSTLVFCDARRRAERLAHLLNEGREENIAFAHHGSLSPEVRRAVEARLKEGKLPCVVATSSLELGIDVGAIDEVVLAGTPPAIASVIQRAGRSGHGVGLVSKVGLYPFHGLDLLLAGAAVRAAREGRIEELRPPRNPLDILAQVLLALAAEGGRSEDALYDIVLSFAPFEELPRALFDSVLALLAGRWAGSRIRELEPRLAVDRIGGAVVADRGALRLLNFSGGSIPDRGLYALRIQGEGKRLGELDEEFVWERRVGDVFAFGSQAWRIVDISAEAVQVRPLEGRAAFMPFWKGGPNHASPELAAGLLDLVERLGTLGPGRRLAFLEEDCGMSVEAAREACRHLEAQEAAQGGLPLPGPTSIILELVEAGRRDGSAAVIVHTLRGGRVNEALALLLSGALAEEGEPEVQAMADDEGVLLVLPPDGGGEESLSRIEGILRRLGDERRAEALLRSRLEGSGLFAAAFRENAGRSLLLPRGLPGKRVPLWVTRLRAARLFEAVAGGGDFPVTLETWRTVLTELLDLEGLTALLDGLATGSILLGSFRSHRPSPFASGARWAETNEYLYRPDDLGGRRSSISDEAIGEALGSAERRPRLDPDLVADFVRRRKRLVEGWAPQDLLELAEWVRERVALEPAELGELGRLGGLAALLDEDPSLGGRLERLRLPGAAAELVVHVERREALLADPSASVAEWLRLEGPLPAPDFGRLFGLAGEVLEGLLESLVAEGLVLRDVLLQGSETPHVVDRQNCEILLRLGRKAARPRVEARPARDLFRFVAAVQGLGDEAAREGAAVLEGLAGYPAPVSAWASRILPLRLGPDWAAVVDRLIAEEGWLWFGTGKEGLAFANAWNYELFAPSGPRVSALLAPGEGPRDFWSLREASGLSSRDCALALWAEAWEGLLSSDSLSSVMQARTGRYGLDLPVAEVEEGRAEEGGRRRLGPRRLPLGLRRRWRSGAPVPGLWSSLALEGEEGDSLDAEELDRERVRLLLKRYGVLLPPLLERELGPLSWKRLFPCIRRLELAGELLYGRYFEGLPGPQFMGTEALGLFRDLDSGEKKGPLWISALDPASPAAFPFDERPSLSPPRSALVSLCLEEGWVRAYARRSGKDLVLEKGLAEEEGAAIVASWAAGKEKIIIETIDGEAAAASPYAPLLIGAGFERDRGRLRRW